MSVDDVVAGLSPVRDEQVTVKGDRELLRAILTEESAADAPRRRPRFRLVLGVALATAAVVVGPVALNVVGDDPVRSYANAAVAIEKRDDTYEVSVKDAFADQRRFREAFAKFELDVRLFITPVSPGNERRVFAKGGGGAPNAPADRQIDISVTPCPKGGNACPMRVRISNALPGDRLLIQLGRRARSGEPYADTISSQSSRYIVPWMQPLGSRDLRSVLRLVHNKGLKAHYAIGRTNPGGGESMRLPSLAWKPIGNRPVMRVWPYSSDAVVILVKERPGDPEKSDPARMDPYGVRKHLTGG
ncbi:hypothetical protein [Actinomadura kijaniata]|uniref:hypothetical protein n=1 Tax=Actinomadura kijaniata TaxID=46161 RepID=UPI000834AE59|nr:hypothetical protein [Actinomadura kijaniata]